MKRGAWTIGAALLLATTAGVAWAFPGGQPGGGPGGRGHGPEALFERFDTDGDEVITREEVDAVRAEMFADADLDGDNVLTLDEMTARAQERLAARVEERFGALDADGDGVVTAEEQQAAARGDMFTWLDRNDDGEITRDEIPDRPGRGGPGRPDGAAGPRPGFGPPGGLDDDAGTGLEETE